MRTTYATIETEFSLAEINGLIKNARDLMVGFIKRYIVESGDSLGFNFRRNQKGTSLHVFILTKRPQISNLIDVRVNHADFKTYYKLSAFVFLIFAIGVGFVIGQILAFFFALIPAVIVFALSRRKPETSDQWIESELWFVSYLLAGKLGNLTVKNN